MRLDGQKCSQKMGNEVTVLGSNASGAPGGQLIQMDWSRFGGNVVSQNLITFENYVPYINGVGCRSFIE